MRRWRAKVRTRRQAAALQPATTSVIFPAPINGVDQRASYASADQPDRTGAARPFREGAEHC
eukprot:3580322-Alexandrium_andersonii.AAC.1